MSVAVKTVIALALKLLFCFVEINLFVSETKTDSVGIMPNLSKTTEKTIQQFFNIHEFSVV